MGLAAEWLETGVCEAGCVRLQDRQMEGGSWSEWLDDVWFLESGYQSP